MAEFDFGKKKKKTVSKKSEDTQEEIKEEKKEEIQEIKEEQGSKEKPQTEESMDFGKKKKKTNKKEGEEEIPPEKTEEKASSIPELDLGKKKKKSTKKKEGEEEGEVNEVENKKDSPTPEGSNSDTEFYTYEFLAKRVYDSINNSGEQEKTKYTMKPPVVYREGTKKTIWVNFPEICKIMNRQPDHVLAFLLAEVGTTGSIDGNARFVIKGRFQPKHIENILRRYIAEYVKCHTCKTPETHLKKENRLLFMVCDKCGSTRTVTPIKTGFQATTRAGRRAART